MVRFQGFESNEMDEEDGRSQISDDSNTTGRASRHKKRSAKPSWTYYLANPAPTKLQQQRILQIRPKLLLQLQHLPPGSRPIPAIDVLPSTVIIPRLIKRFPRIFRGSDELGANDLQIVRSETYATPEDEQHRDADSGDDYANRELLAVICEAGKEAKGSPGKAEIVMTDGTVWDATPQQNGSFEFITIDTEGKQTTARWVKRPKRHSTDMSEGVEANDIHFSFSIINPESRRHAILATLTSTQLRIPESYTPISSSSGILPPSTRTEVLDGGGLGRLTLLIDEKLKLLIQITGIWVAMRSGICKYFKYNDELASSINRTRAVSMSMNGGLPSPSLRADTPESNHSAFAVVGDKIRRSCALGSAPSSPFEKQVIPQRSVSTGSAFVQKQTARRGLQPSTVASGSEAESMAPPLIRAHTDAIGNLSTPPPNGLSSSCTTTPDTPTRNPAKNSRRPHSTLTPSSVGNGKSRRETQSVDIQERNGSPDIGKRQTLALKPQKLSRWKSFSNFFKRGSKKSDYS